MCATLDRDDNSLASSLFLGGVTPMHDRGAVVWYPSSFFSTLSSFILGSGRRSVPGGGASKCLCVWLFEKRRRNPKAIFT